MKTGGGRVCEIGIVICFTLIRERISQRIFSEKWVQWGDANHQNTKTLLQNTG